jgi:hypothetical protein
MPLELHGYNHDPLLPTEPIPHSSMQPLPASQVLVSASLNLPPKD